MRTTIDIEDATYADLKSQAAKERTSIKALIESAVQLLLVERRRNSESRVSSHFAWPTIGDGKGTPVQPVDNDSALFRDLDGE